MKPFIPTLLVASLLPGLVSAALIQTLTDSTGSASVTVNDSIGTNEYGTGNSQSFANGSGSGFGGTLGGGRFYFESDATNLYIGFKPGAGLNDNVALWLDTRTGGFSDATMNDTADGGRLVITNGAINANDPFPAGILPDFGVVFGNFGSVAFELTAGSLNFINFVGPTGSDKEISITLSALGVSRGSTINFFAGYASAGGFGSNESLPFSVPLNSTANPGFGTFSAGYDNYNAFFVPEPSSCAAAAGVIALGLAVARRRRS